MNTDGPGTSKQNKQPYSVPFRDEWAKQFPWIIKDGQNKKCKICNLPITGGIFHIKRHETSESHIRKTNAAKTTPKINNFIKSSTCPIAESTKKFEIMLSLFIAEHNLPFSILDHLNNVIKAGVTDSQITKMLCINRTKAQKIVTNITGPENANCIANFCKDNYYSLVIDESTDCSISKNLAIVIRIFDGQCRDRFLALVHIDDSSANGILQATLKVLNENKIPINNMIAVTTDNCAVMMGANNGFQSKLKALVPSLFTNGCICHILNLVSYAASKFSIPDEIDKFIKDINYHFCNSSNRRDDFSKFQEYFGTDIHVILKYSTTRWLSRQEVINRIFEQWEPLQYYFTLNDFEADSQNVRLNSILSAFSNPLYKMVFYFLQYILKIINTLNLEMQSEDARMHIFLDRLKFLFRQIARNFIHKDMLDESDILKININENHIPMDEIYCGTEIDVYISLNNIENSIVMEFKEIAKNFYLKFCEVLKAKVDFNNEMLLWFCKFTPENVVSGRTSSIVPLILKMFPNEKKNIESINNQFRALADVDILKSLKNDNICSFWSKVSEMKNELNELMFTDCISRIARGLLSIPHSSANVERIFSYQNIIKTKERNRLFVSTVSNLIQTKDLLKSSNSCCYNLEITNNLLAGSIS